MRRFPVQRFRSRMERMSGEGADSPARLEAVLAANGTDLPSVMSGVDEVEPAPLGDAERAEDLVGSRALVAEDTIEIMAEPKIDGLSLALRYQSGRLALGATRGDGVTGENVTTNIRTLDTVPEVLAGEDWPELIEIRGEVYLERDGRLTLSDLVFADDGHLMQVIQRIAARMLCCSQEVCGRSATDRILDVIVDRGQQC